MQNKDQNNNGHTGPNATLTKIDEAEAKKLRRISRYPFTYNA
jgi:hypothetical protein